MTIDSSCYPFLARALGSNRNLSEIIDETYRENEKYLRELDDFFKELFDGGCANIEQKMADVDGLHKLKSTVAELCIGREFLRAGCSVSFISDVLSSKKSPDIRVNKNGKELLIEVMRIGDGPVLDILLDGLRNFLKKKPYRVDVKLDEKLSLPPIGYKEFEIAKQEIQASLELFKRDFKTVSHEYSIRTPHVEYRVQHIKRSDGYPGIIRHEVIGVPVKEILNYLAYWAEKKANKRIDFDRSDIDIPYIVAFFADMAYLDGVIFKEFLYGRVMGYEDNDRHHELILHDYEKQVNLFKSSSEWVRIEEASERGWKDFLERIYLIPNDLKYVYEHGLFLCVKSMDNAEGLMLFTPGDRVAFFPNPFSDYNLKFDEIIELIKMIDTMFR